MSKELRQAEGPIKCQLLDKDGNIVFEGEVQDWKITHGGPILQSDGIVWQCVGHSVDSFEVKGMKSVKITDNEITKAKVACSHKWVEYEGFTDYYEFCDLCGVKK